MTLLVQVGFPSLLLLCNVGIYRIYRYTYPCFSIRKNDLRPSIIDNLVFQACIYEGLRLTVPTTILLTKKAPPEGRINMLICTICVPFVC